MEALEQFIRRHVTSARTILDIGCGDGELLRRLCHGYRAQGIGVETNPAWHETQIDNVELIAADYVSWQSAQRFDLVVASGVLHLLEIPDDVLLHKLCGHLAPRGFIVYELPLQNLSNRLAISARQTLRALRGSVSDRIISAAGRLFYIGRANAKFIEDRLRYIYLTPFRDVSFNSKLEQRGLEMIAETIAPRQSIIELYAQRAVRRLMQVVA